MPCVSLYTHYDPGKRQKNIQLSDHLRKFEVR